MDANRNNPMRKGKWPIQSVAFPPPTLKPDRQPPEGAATVVAAPSFPL